MIWTRQITFLKKLTLFKKFTPQYLELNSRWRHENKFSWIIVSKWPVWKVEKMKSLSSKIKPEKTHVRRCFVLSNSSENKVFSTSCHPRAVLDWSDDNDFLFSRGEVVHLFAVQKEWRNDSIKFEKKLHVYLYTSIRPRRTDVRGVL